MPTFADFITFADAAFDLPTGTPKKWDFSTQIPSKFSKDGVQGVLSFMLHANDADDLQLLIEVGGPKTVAKIKLDGDYFQTIQELMDPNQIAAGNLFFTRTGGAGTLKISDVVLWLRLNG